MFPIPFLLVANPGERKSDEFVGCSKKREITLLGDVVCLCGVIGGLLILGLRSTKENPHDWMKR